MAEPAEDAVLETPDPKVEASARELGWVPEKDFRGDKARWVDAKTFVEKGQVVLPILRRQNQDLQSELQALRAADAARDAEMKTLKAALRAVEEAQEEDLTERVAATKADLEDQIAAASEAADHKRVARLTGDLAELIAADRLKAARTVETPAKPDAQPAAVQLRPEYLAWAASNKDWLDKDVEKTQLALAFGQVIAAGGQFKGTAFYAELDKRLDRYYRSDDPPASESKVEGGRPSSSGPSGGSAETKTAYADLPRDAKEVCDRLSRKMVGDGKAHKDEQSWRKSYARQYFEQEAR